MNKKIITIISVGILVIGGGMFYGGMKYGQSRFAFPARGESNFFVANGEKQAGFRQSGLATGGVAAAGSMIKAGGMSGEILSKDNTSLTLKMRDGGSKIIFFGSSVVVSKTIAGLLSDLKIGDSVSVMGDANSDGSINAKTIQIQNK